MPFGALESHTFGRLALVSRDGCFAVFLGVSFFCCFFLGVERFEQRFFLLEDADSVRTSCDFLEASPKRKKKVGDRVRPT